MKVQVHTRRIVFSILGFSTFILTIYIFYFDIRIGYDKRLIQRIVESNIRNTKIYSISNLNRSHLACIQPNLKLNLDFDKYKIINDPIYCGKEKDWIEIRGHTASIVKTIKQIYANILCTFTELLFENDDTTKLGLNHEVKNSIELTTDFYAVSCLSKNGSRWNSVIAGIGNNLTIKMETDWNFVPKTAVRMNVLLLGFDSLSRINFMRTLPETYRYLKEEMDSNILEGYNIIGDGTPQAIIPMLTGQTEFELPETRKRLGKYANYVEVYPFIWNDFKKNGYVTMFAEDQPKIGTFSYRLKGFSKPPTDHYMRIFYNYAVEQYENYSKYCLSGTPRHKIFLNYLKNFFEVYRDKPKFGFAMHSELSHNDYNLINVADKDILEFLKHFKNNYLDDTILILFSDHGNRFASIRKTQQGKQEERLPFVSIYLPPKFKRLYPSAALNVRVNSERLATPFDIYATLKDLVSFPGAKLGNTAERAISLFSEIPPSRTCSNAFIEPHWCACLTWEPLSTTDDKATEAAHALVHYINTYTAPYRAYCHEVKLIKVFWASLMIPNKDFLHFKHTFDRDGFLADLTDNTAITEEVYQISISTTPKSEYFQTSSGFPIYEASLTYNVKQDSFSVKMDDVSRINKYGDQPHCITTVYPELRKFCYCLQPPKDG